MTINSLDEKKHDTTVWTWNINARRRRNHYKDTHSQHHTSQTTFFIRQNFSFWRLALAPMRARLPVDTPYHSARTWRAYCARSPYAHHLLQPTSEKRTYVIQVNKHTHTHSWRSSNSQQSVDIKLSTQSWNYAIVASKASSQKIIHVTYSGHRRGQDSLWGALFFPQKADDLFLFLVVAPKTQATATKLATPTVQISPIS